MLPVFGTALIARHAIRKRRDFHGRTDSPIAHAPLTTTADSGYRVEFETMPMGARDRRGVTSKFIRNAAGGKSSQMPTARGGKLRMKRTVVKRQQLHGADVLSGERNDDEIM
ncbi:hypothetical protein EVAR_45540_1 [Eumeta japonica]|uniref:Uncharacterized protein n=1 Tax=Eumeta variegata TaxID=151549 RepID=A0A4C1X8I9_EUMVA|nr:hypothetical protein EVAR_45540_1 [Eumeta japonica]